MGGRLGKKGLPFAEDNLKDPEPMGSGPEQEEPSGRNGVNKSGPRTLQEEDASVSQVSPEEARTERGDAASITEEPKSADASVGTSSRTDQPHEIAPPVPSREAPTDAALCTEIQTVGAVPEEVAKVGTAMTPPALPSDP